MPKAIRYEEYGGPEVLNREDVLAGKPRANEVRIKHSAIGVKFSEVYARKDAALAHQKLEARETVGSTLLIP